MIIDSAEREYATRTALGTATAGMACTDVASLSTTDYILSSTNACSISFDANGAATGNTIRCNWW